MAYFAKITFATIFDMWWKLILIMWDFAPLPCDFEFQMSILNYFRRKSNILPEPSERLSNLIPLRAIAAANEEVSNLVHTTQSSHPKKRLRRTNKNNVCSPSQLRAEMGEAALKLGMTTASRNYSAKLSMRMNKSTMRGLKKYMLWRGNGRDVENRVN